MSYMWAYNLCRASWFNKNYKKTSQLLYIYIILSCYKISLQLHVCITYYCRIIYDSQATKQLSNLKFTFIMIIEPITLLLFLFTLQNGKQLVKQSIMTNVI